MFIYKQTKKHIKCYLYDEFCKELYTVDERIPRALPLFKDCEVVEPPVKHGIDGFDGSVIEGNSEWRLLHNASY